MDVVPGVEHPALDVVAELVHVLFGHGLAAEVDPFAEAFAFHHGAQVVDAGVLMVFEVVEDVLHGVVQEDLAVGVVGLAGFQDTHLAVSFLDVLAEHLQLLAHFGLVVEEVLAGGAEVVILTSVGVLSL